MATARAHWAAWTLAAGLMMAAQGGAVPVPGTPTDPAPAKRLQPDVAADPSMAQKISRYWRVNCDTPGFNETVITLGFVLDANGRVVRGPAWLNPRDDEVWQAAADRAKAALLQAQPFEGLPARMSGPRILMDFDARQACRR